MCWILVPAWISLMLGCAGTGPLLRPAPATEPATDEPPAPGPSPKCDRTGGERILAVDFAGRSTDVQVYAPRGDQPVDAAGRAPLIYAAIGTHLAITGAAMAYLAIMGIRSLGGNYSAKDVEGLYGAAMFWFVMVTMYFALWYAIYITK